MARGNNDNTAVIAASGTNSTSINVTGRAFGTFQTPAALTSTSFTFQGQVGESGTWATIKDDTGTALSVTVAASGVYRIPDGCFGCGALRIVAGSAEAAERTIYVELMS